MMELLQDPTLWLAFSFVIFAFILVKKGGGAFLGMLDHKIATIRKDLETAESLRVEAQEMLAQYQRKHRDAVGESEDILRATERRVLEMKQEAERELHVLTLRREKQLADTLARLEEAAIAEIKSYAADLAIKATKTIIEDQLDKAGNDQLVDGSIKALSKAIK